MTLRNAVGDRITTYCILDSDYHSDDEICERYTEAENRGVNLHVWSRKEIESFLLQPRAIRRVLKARIKSGEVPSETELRQKLLEICEGERRAIEDAFASAIIKANRRLDLITANRSARAHVEKVWQSEDARLAIASGKNLLAELSRRTQSEFGVTFGPPAIARHMTQPEIARELAEVIRAIEEGSGFPSLEERQTWVA